MTTKTAAQLTAEAEAAGQAARAAQEQAAALRAQAAQARYAERRAAQEAARQALSDRLYTEVGEPLAGLNQAQHALVFDRAWSQSKSEGDHGVEATYGELAELARATLAAA